MKIGGNAIRPGMIIQHNNKLLKAIRIQHVKPGKGPAYLQTELKDIVNGTKIHERFRSDETVERISLEPKDCQFLYVDQDIYYFMDKENFEQVPLIKSEIAEEQLPYIAEEINVTIEFFDNKPISILLPPSVILEITETEPSLKGQTATSSFKPAILSNGVRTMVPQHIEIGTKVVINPEDSSYMERAK
jgi:elongation factor P